MWAGFPRPQNVVEVRDPRHPICHFVSRGSSVSDGLSEGSKGWVQEHVKEPKWVSNQKKILQCPLKSEFTLMQSKGVLEPSMVGTG